MEVYANPAFCTQDEDTAKQNELSTLALEKPMNNAIAPDEHYREVRENCSSEDTPRLRRNISSHLAVPISNNETNGKTPNDTNQNIRTWNVQHYRNVAQKVLVWMLHLCVVAYFVAAIIFWNMQGECDLEWCNGLGMLIILVVLIYSGLAYYYIIKKYFGEGIYSNVYKPVQQKWSNLRYTRYLKIAAVLLPLLGIIVFLIIDTIGSSERLISGIGIVVIIITGYVFSKHRRKIKWRPVLCGMIIQFLFGLITIRWYVGRNIFKCLGDKATVFLGYSNQGARFVYGNDLIDSGVFAFQPMSVMFFLCFFVQILYYYGAMQWAVIKLGWIIQISMGTTVCESVNAAASIVLGLSESPVLFKPYLKDLTKSELHAVMTGGFATVAGSVMAAYISFGVSPAHLITASVMSAPAALCYAKLFYPETQESSTRAESMKIEKGDETSVLDAATKGALTAVQLVLGIIANIIAFISFIAFINGLLSWLGMLVGAEGLTLEFILGKVFIPLAWIMGVDWMECEDVARLIGLKTIVNEFVAYEQLGRLKLAGKLSQRSEMIATYALCGFANPGSIGISIGALVTMAPNQRSAVTEVAFRAFIAGSATCFLTACIAGMLMPDDYFPGSENNSMGIFNVTSGAL